MKKPRFTEQQIAVAASRAHGARPVRGQGRLFTITDLRVHHPDLGVHHERSGCSRCVDPSVHVRPIQAFSLGRYAHQEFDRAACHGCKHSFPPRSG
jgi:hypothetical protein